MTMQEFGLDDRDLQLINIALNDLSEKLDSDNLEESQRILLTDDLERIEFLVTLFKQNDQA